MKRSISLITVLCLLTGILNLTAFAVNNNRAEDWSLTRLSPFGDASQQYSVTQVQDGVQFTAMNDTYFTNNNQADIADINAKVRLDTVPGYSEAGQPKPQINGISYVFAVKNVTTVADYGTRNDFKGVMFYVYYNRQSEYAVEPVIIGGGEDNWDVKARSYPFDPSGKVDDGGTLDFKFAMNGNTITATINGTNVLSLSNAAISESDFANGAYLQTGMHASVNAGSFTTTVLSYDEKPEWIISESPGGGSSSISSAQDGTVFSTKTDASFTKTTKVDAKGANLTVRLDNIPGYMSGAAEGKPQNSAASLLVALKDSRDVNMDWANRDKLKGLAIYLFFATPTQLQVEIDAVGAGGGNWTLISYRTPIDTTVKDGSEVSISIRNRGGRSSVWVNNVPVIDRAATGLTDEDFAAGAYLQVGMHAASNYFPCGFTVTSFDDPVVNQWLGGTVTEAADKTTVSTKTGNAVVVKSQPVTFDGTGKSVSVVFSADNIPCYQSAVPGKVVDKTGSNYNMIFEGGNGNALVVRFIPLDLETCNVQLVKMVNGEQVYWPHDNKAQKFAFRDGEIHFLSLKQIDGHLRVCIDGTVLPHNNFPPEYEPDVNAIFDDVLTGDYADITLNTIMSADGIDQPLTYSFYNVGQNTGFHVYGTVEQGQTATEKTLNANLLAVNDTDTTKSAAGVLAKYDGMVMTDSEILADGDIAPGAVKKIAAANAAVPVSGRINLLLWDSFSTMQPISIYQREDETVNKQNEFRQFSEPPVQYNMYQMVHEQATEGNTPDFFRESTQGGW